MKTNFLNSFATLQQLTLVILVFLTLIACKTEKNNPAENYILLYNEMMIRTDSLLANYKKMTPDAVMAEINEIRITLGYEEDTGCLRPGLCWCTGDDCKGFKAVCEKIIGESYCDDTACICRF